MFEYPNKLNNIFEKLNKYNIRAVIVGGYVRDFFLGIESKDIDIELYNIDSLQKVENILSEFGKVNNVGKSFGVVKLLYEDLDLDLSLPRSDSKTATGHKGFDVTIHNDFNFTKAAKRRDFTINAIGYDVVEKKILDPYNGIEDLKKRLLKAVDIEKFSEDPLRVLRAVTFASRFTMQLDKDLFFVCKKLIQNGVLKELPKERIFEEIKKLLLKSPQPSIGLKLLEALSAFNFFNEFQNLNKEDLNTISQALDSAASFHFQDNKHKITLMLALLISRFSKEKQLSFLQKLTNQKDILKDVIKITHIQFDLQKQNNYTIYKLAKEIDISYFALYLKALYPDKQKSIETLLKKAKKLNVLYKPLQPLIKGKDLIEMGIEPSRKFSEILETLYDKQMKEDFYTKEEAIEWLNRSGILS